MIVADTGGILALLDADDKHHRAVAELFQETGASWMLPWAILPEVDYLASTRLGTRVAEAFVEDLRDGLFVVDGAIARDLPRAAELLDQYRALRMGLVDAVVMAQAERHSAAAILTLDEKHFRAVRWTTRTPPSLYPADL